MNENELDRVSRKRFIQVVAGGLVASVVAACGKTPTSEPTSPPADEPSPTKKPSPEPSPKATRTVSETTPEPTVVVETIGFGGIPELTEEEQQVASVLEQAYRESAQTQDLEGTVVLTRGDDEGEIGAFFRDGQENPWSLVTRTVEGTEKEILEQVPFYEGVVAEWKPNEMRFEYLVDGETFVFEPENRILINGEGKVISEWNTETSSWKEVPEPTPDLRPQRANEAIDVYLRPGEDRVGYLVEGANFTPTGAEQNGWVEIIDANGNRLWIEVGSAYMPEEEYVPPAPTATPETAGSVCEVPHFGGRTEDRKTGYIIAFGNYRPEIFPDGNPHNWIQVDALNLWLTKRDGRIIAIDRENQIITFDLGNGIIAKRKFEVDTQVVMVAHNIRIGMPTTESVQAGGNLCDLEVGDAAAILHPNEEQGTNPSLEGNLWGIYIVQ